MTKVTVHFEDLTREELRAGAPEWTVLVPLGSTEQHGPDLPVSTDTTIVNEVAVRAVRQCGPGHRVVVAPPMPFGFAHHHLSFGGTISISSAVYSGVLTDVGASLAEAGFRRIVFLNGHGGNQASLAQALDRLAYEEGLPAHIAGLSYWALAAAAFAEIAVDDSVIPGHAGLFERSCMLALRPEMVHDPTADDAPGLTPLARQARHVGTQRHPGVWQASNGRTDDGAAATADMGERFLDAAATAVAGYLDDFVAESR